VTQAPAAAIGASLPNEMDDEDRRTVLSLAYSIMAVAPAPKYQQVPAAERCRIWARNEPGAPDDLPGRGGGAQLRPIAVQHALSGA